jgi:hypothetical protein
MLFESRQMLTETSHEDLHHISLITLAFRADFHYSAADNGGDRTTWNRLGRITE